MVDVDLREFLKLLDEVPAVPPSPLEVLDDGFDFSGAELGCELVSLFADVLAPLLGNSALSGSSA